MSEWSEMACAPKGGGADMVTDPEWIEPPLILLLFDCGSMSVCRWDYYYAIGGSGYTGGLAWVEPVSGEMVDLTYDAPIGWMPLPEPPCD